MQVFLAYTRKDEEAGKAVRKALKQAGFSVWDPAIDAPATNNFAHEIGDALERADAMVVLVSPEAMESELIRWGLDHALTTMKFEGRLLPVELRPTETFPWVLRRFKVLDFTSRADPAQVVEAMNEIRDAA